jgi:DNA integrity scanning protein DisA with diadenylate cyclase activity
VDKTKKKVWISINTGKTKGIVREEKKRLTMNQPPLEKRYEIMRKDLESFLSQKVSSPNELRIYDIMSQIRTQYDTFVSAKDALTNAISQAVAQHSNCTSEFEKADLLENIIDKHRQHAALETAAEYAHHGSPAFIVVIGYDTKNNSHHYHTFNGDWYDKKIEPNSQESFDEMKKIAYKDNAVVLDKNGNIIAKKVLLTNLDPEQIMKKNGYEIHSSLNSSEAMGFKIDVNARHKNALAASYQMDDIVIYTLGETTGDIRRMQHGKITHSTVPGEGKYQLAK